MAKQMTKQVGLSLTGICHNREIGLLMLRTENKKRNEGAFPPTPHGVGLPPFALYEKTHNRGH